MSKKKKQEKIEITHMHISETMPIDGVMYTATRAAHTDKPSEKCVECDFHRRECCDDFVDCTGNLVVLKRVK